MVEPAAAADHATHQALEQKLAAALALSVRNDDVVRSCNSAFDEGAWIAASQLKAKESTAQELGQAFNPQVLAVLKRNADQLQELKQQHIAQKQMTRDTTRKLMWWASGQQQSGNAAAAAADDLQADAVKHGRFKFFQLPGSSISSGANTGSNNNSQAAAAFKFWQTGVPAAAAVPRAFSDTPCGGDQLQPQKSFTNLLFGKSRRSSSGGGGAPPPAAAPSSRRASDAATNSWRASNDGGSRGTSGRSSDSGTLRASASFGTQMMMMPQQQQPAAVQEQQQQEQGSGIWASLATGEGPLSKSHSLLARSSMPQEQAVGKGLECVAEDEREGRDSPQPGAGCTLEPALMATFNPAQHSHHLSALRAQLAGPGRATSPIESFSFGNKQEDEQPHSPNFLLRASVSSRLMEQRGQSGDTAPGPLMRSSVALASSRVDPFDAPEPQPQPFVEQMRAEDQAMKAASSATRDAGAATSRSFVGALRRSMGGALRVGGMAAAAPVALAAAAAGTPAGLLARRQVQQPRPLLLDGSSPGPLTGGAGHMLGQQQPQGSPNPTSGEMVAFLDLDATRAYAMGVHEVMEGLVHNIKSERTGTASETSSKPQSPSAAAAAMAGQQHRHEDAAAAAARAAVAMTAAAEAARAASPPRPPVNYEIVPAGESVDEQQRQRASRSGQQEQQLQLERQHSQRRLQPPSPALSPQSSGMMPSLPPASAAARQQQQHQQQHAGALAAGMVRSLRPSTSSGAGSRRQSSASNVASVGSVASRGTRGLPMMGQASIDILGRPSVGHSSKQPLNSSLAAVRLTDVYSATSGNLTPLSAGLTSIRRQSSSSQSSRTTLPPRARTSPRALVSEASMQAAALPAAGMGPLAAQHSSTMLHAKKQPGAAAAAGPQEGATPGRKSPWGWKALGLPTGPGAPLADQTIDPMTYPKGNKYAASWGLVDAAATAAASPGGALSRQASAVAGGLSRQQSQAALQGQLSRQSSGVSQRQSPRYADQQQQGANGTPARQYNAGAAGRYAQHAQSVTPAESPRSGAGTPRRGSDSGRQGRGGGSAGKTLQSRRISDVGSVASDDSGAYASADEHSRASSFSGYTSAASTGSRGAWQRSNSATQQGSNSRTNPSPIPVPPAFLQSSRPTSAQAAVAAAWSPNKHASAMVQAPAYMRGAYVAPEASGGQYGEAPRGLAGAAAYSSVSPRDAYAQPGGAAPRSGNAAAAAAGGGYQQPRQQLQQAAYAGGYNVQGSAAPLAAGARGQQQQVVTAVDLAKSRSMRRTSCSGGGGQGGSYGSRQPEAPGYLGAARSNASGARGVGAAAGKAVYGQRQLQGGGRRVVAGEFDDYY